MHMPEHEAEHEQQPTPHTDPLPEATTHLQVEDRVQPAPAAAISTPMPETTTSPAAQQHSNTATPGTAHPRSLKRRLEQQQATGRTSRVRSQPLNATPPKRVREPVLLEWEPEPMTGPWRAKPFVVGLAIAAWIVAAGLLVSDPGRDGQATGLVRVLVPLVWATAAAITFVPIQLRLALPGIGWQSIVGFGLLGYILAFVPAPTGWLLDLPDLPVYLLLFLAIFYAISAAIVPLTYLLGQRYYRLRIHRLDVGRARRQAYEVGLLIVVTLVMAGLRVLSPVTFGLLVLIIVLTEALLLSQVQPEG
jgi:hypothetical protein